MINIEIISGDLIDQTTDVVVNNISTDLIIGSSPVEEALLENDDDNHIRNSIYASNPVSIGDIIITEPGGLSAKVMAHAVITSELTPPSDKSLIKCIIHVLEYMEEKNYTSVAFPPLGTRLCHYTMDDSANASIIAVNAYQKAHPDTKIDLVKFVMTYDADLPTWTDAKIRIIDNAAKPAVQ